MVMRNLLSEWTESGPLQKAGRYGYRRRTNERRHVRGPSRGTGKKMVVCGYAWVHDPLHRCGEGEGVSYPFPAGAFGEALVRDRPGPDAAPHLLL